MSDPITLEVVPITGVPKQAIEAFQPSAIDRAKQERDRLLGKCSTITEVKTAEQLAFAAKGLKALKGFSREIEETRQAVKAPVNDLGKRIDAVADTLTFSVEAEAKRLSALVGAYQLEQNRIAEEARREAWKKEQELRQKADQEQREREAKALAEEEELRKKAEAAKTPAAKAKLEAKLEQTQQANLKEDLKAQEATAVAVVEVRGAALEIPQARKPSGIATQNELKFEVEDAAALYKAHPLLVSLVPQKALIKAALKNLRPGETLPGVKHWEEAKAIVRG